MIQVSSTPRFALAAKGLVVVAAIMLSVIIQELAVRLALPVYDPSRQVRFIEETATTPQIGPAGVVRRLTKNTREFDVTVRFNRHGMRDAKDFASAGPNDLFVVGDSYAFGWGVEERDRVSERLQAQLGRPVYNLSAGGGDLENYIRLLDYAVGRGAAIGKTVVAVNMATDLRVYGAPERKSAPSTLSLHAIKAFLIQRSALYFMTTSLVHNSPWLRRTAVWAGLIVPTGRSKPSKGTDLLVLDSSARWLKALFARYPGVALVIPSREVWSTAQGEETRRIHHEFIARLRALEIDTLDLLPAFELGVDPSAMHFRTDAHWNAAGHDLAARALADHIKRGAEAD